MEDSNGSLKPNENPVKYQEHKDKVDQLKEQIDQMIKEAEYNKNLKTTTKRIAVDQQVLTGEYHE